MVHHIQGPRVTGRL
ncbi:hypothetical protein P4O66_021698 [Electrophorus voltai]|uniref:Uncharacterized protein n=1 Tax=Electrophorus voltai TaxID=2609070 RepID=A0AAD8ZTE8_9TELE|nr:hypothetical protein P4O66_021698 [Electrophorus voltai]